jgi:hypothetical protein
MMPGSTLILSIGFMTSFYLESTVWMFSRNFRGPFDSATCGRLAQGDGALPSF